MKKVISCLFALALVFTFVSCDDLLGTGGEPVEPPYVWTPNLPPQAISDLKTIGATGADTFPVPANCDFEDYEYVSGFKAVVLQWSGADKAKYDAYVAKFEKKADVRAVAITDSMTDVIVAGLKSGTIYFYNSSSTEGDVDGTNLSARKGDIVFTLIGN